MAQSQSPTPESNNSPSDNADSIITASSEEASVEQEREALKKARDADAPDSADGEGAAAHGNLHFGEEEQGELKKYEDTPDDAVPSEVGAPDPSHGQQNAGSGVDGSDNETVTSTDEEEKTADPANAEGGVPSPSADTSYATSSSSLGDEPVESTSSAKTTSGDEEPTGAGVERTPASETSNESPTDLDLSDTSVDENDAGAVVATLTTSDADSNDTATYSIVEDPSGFFEVVGNELRLRDGVSLDHEAQDAYEIVLQVEDSAGNVYTETVTIDVNDVNEGPSGVSLSNTTIDENDAGAVVGTVSAVDPDDGDSLTYTVSDDRFEIVGNELRLKDGVSLDHEAAETIDVTVTATDQGGLESSQAFTINVDDVNEGPSGVSLSNTTIDENDAGAVVGTVSAVDPDDGDSLTYTVSDDRFEIVGNELRLKDGVSLDHETAETIDLTVTATDQGGLESSQAFTINVDDVNEGPSGVSLSNTMIDENDAGAVVGAVSAVDPDDGDSLTYTVSDDRFEIVGNELRLKDGVSLDHETAETIDVTVTATDQGGLESSQAFTINVDDVNEGPSGVSLSNTTIDENDAGAVVGAVSAVDPDDGDSLTYTVSDDRFEIVGNELRLKDGVSLDHETAETIDVTVTATDQGGLESSQAFTINVDDVNEGPSGVSLSNTTIDENDAGAVVGAVSAVDPDDGDSLTYTVSDDRFEIVGNELRLKDGVSLDHETAETIDVTVTATDQGGLESSQAFTINVDDVNEGPSGVSLSNTTIDENDAGAVVGTVSAVDPDDGDSLTYTVSDDRFEIVGNELRLKDGVSLDHETAETIDVTVTATDQGGLESSQAFTINVDDVNEGPSGVSLSNTTIDENDAGAVVGAVSAVDPDDGDSLTYTVSDDRFEIVGNELRLKDGVSLDHETAETIDVTVTATDQGGLESSQAFTINVDDVNEGPSGVSLSNTTIDENDAGAVVGAVSAVDPDDGDSLTYTVSDDRFEIVGNELRLKDGVSLDHETAETIDVTVTATDQGGLESSQAFTINVDDVNEGPSGVSLSNTTIDENDAGAVVGAVSAVDPDDGDSLTYTVSDDRFEIVGNELRLKDGVSLDHETAETIDVTVTATDQGGLESSQAFTINVDDVNEGPSGVSLSNTTIDENDAGAVVGTVSAVDPDDGDSLTYTVSDDRFEIVGNELRLKDGVSLDHEAAETIDVTVTATDQGGLESSEAFTINVDDVNEGPSGVSLSNTTIDENDAGAVVGTVSAVDPDDGDSLTYTVSDDRFEIVGNELRLKDGVSLDHETAETIDVTVTATDQGGLESSEAFTINVDDVNEGPSGVSLSNTTIDENDAGAVVGTVSAVDPDDGDSLTYTVSDDRFEIVGNELRLKDGVSLDHETAETIDVTVTATDQGGLESSQAFTINVDDVNEGPSGVSLSNTMIDENDAGAVVGTVSAVDPDDGDSLTYTVSDDRFEIVGNELRLKDGVSLDHETAETIDVTVTATDQGGLESSQAFTINVDDVNEGPSGVSLSNTTIDENDAGAVVGAVSAVDPDDGDSLTYTVSDDRFEIVGNELRLKDGVSLDHETAETIDVTVTATDQGGLESSQAFTINVDDVNEGPSGVSLSNTTIDENDAGAVVGTVSAVDPDDGDSLTYTVSDDRFEIVGNELRLKDGVSLDHETAETIDVTVTATDQGGLESSQAFTINVDDVNEGPSGVSLSNTTIDENDAGAVVGTVSAVDPDDGDSLTYTVSDDRFEIVGNELRLKDGVSLDHETAETIDVTVTATDQGGLESSQAFTINVDDVNEGPSGVSLSNTMIDENDAGAVVGAVSAVDPDDGDSLTYTVSDDRFEIVGNELRLKDGVSLDHETAETIDVTVTATDQGGLESSQAFTINVDDVNEGPSGVSLSNTTIDENDAGAVVGAVSAVDPDDGDSLTYTVSDDRFEIVGNELRLKDGVSLDHETAETIDVTVTATDQGGLESSQAFTINVDDVNEGPSGVSLSNTTIDENDAGAVVGTVSAVDPDDGDSLTYTVSDDRFEIVGNELRLKDGVSLDHETAETIDVTVTATDQGGLESSQAFTINVDDVNEGPSGVSLSNTMIDENDAGAVVGTVSAVDPDDGDSLTYTVSDDRFEIVGNELRLKDGVSLDHETAETIDVTVTATDQGGLESSQAFTINVDDVNEGPSGVSLSNTTIDENDAGAVVGAVSAVDPDDGDSLTYTVSDDRFEIVGNELRLKDGVSLDHETAETIDVTVTATDQGGLESSQAFTINVDDVNEGPSGVSLSNTTIDENDAGAVVGTVSAVDPDDGDSLTYTVSDDRFEIVGNELRLKDGVSLDHETAETIDVTVTATDQGGLESSQAFTINVDDVNEGPSGVSLSSDRDVVQENAAVSGAEMSTSNGGGTNTATLDLSADNADSAAVTINFEYLDNSFEIVVNGQSLTGGTIQLQSNIYDPATESFLQFEDGSAIHQPWVPNEDGSPRIQVVITEDGVQVFATRTPTSGVMEPMELTNGDFNLPDFIAGENSIEVINPDQHGPDGIRASISATHDGTDFIVGESETGAVVGTVSAVDPDDGDSLTYTVSDDRFEIVGNELRLKDGVSLDHETAETIDVTVTATDQGGLESSQAFTINVDDVNEGPSGVSLSNTTIDENDAGAVVGTVSAVDPDDGDSLTYTVSDDRFEIVGNELRLKDGVSLDHETAETIDVTVTATDQGGLESSQAFTINVDDVNEGPSGVSLSNTTIDENDAGAVVGTVSAVDPDDGDSLTYTVSDDRFEIVGNELRLKDGVSLDHETAETIDVTVTATDQGGLESSQAFTINVDDVNEGPSGVSLSNTTIDENDAGAVVGTVSAVDPDDGDSLTYTVSDDRFEIVGNELRLKDGVSLDHETAETIDVTVTATDQGGLESSQAFTINVDDVNEGPSGVSLSNTTIDENDAGAVVGTVSAVDPDDGDSLTYTVSDDRFEIVGNELRLKDGVSLDHEAAETIDVTVTATDQGGLESSQAFTINVDDVNEGNLILGTDSGNILIGGDTEDEIVGGGSNDILSGHDGDDIIYGDGTVPNADDDDEDGDEDGDGDDEGDGEVNIDGNDLIFGGDGDDQIHGNGGNDSLFGQDGSDVFVYEMGDGSDKIYGGSGGGWTDVIQLSDGETSLGEYGVDWTLEVTDGSIISVDEDGIKLSDDADGIITLSDGSTIEFSDIEEIVI